MTNLIKPVSESSALVLYNPAHSQLSAQEARTDAAFRRSFENAKYETSRLHQPARFQEIRSRFCGGNLVYISGLRIIPPHGLKTDSHIDIEIFASKSSNQNSPLLIFSHGMETPPTRYRPLLAELASHGCTLLSVKHASSLEVLQLSPAEERIKAEELAHLMTNNIHYLLEEVRDGSLRGIGNTNKIVLGGHSLGGAASIMVARHDEAIAGCVNLDGFLHGNAKTEGLKQPLLMMIGDHENRVREELHSPDPIARDQAKFHAQSLQEYDVLRRNSADAEKLMIKDAIHMDFTDQPFEEHLAGQKSLIDAMRVHTIVSEKMLQFMHDVTSAHNRTRSV